MNERYDHDRYRIMYMVTRGCDAAEVMKRILQCSVCVWDDLDEARQAVDERIRLCLHMAAMEACGGGDHLCYGMVAIVDQQVGDVLYQQALRLTDFDYGCAHRISAPPLS